jgi:nucleotide-binding universal stress UspA family protein
MVNYMIAVDGSDFSNAAFFTGLGMVNTAKDHVYVITVVEDIRQFYSTWTFGPVFIPPDVNEKAKDHARRLLHRYLQVCKKASVQATGLLAVSSHSGEALCQAVDSKKIDFLIVARRGLGVVKRFFVGSTTKYCVENANCNVLVLKGDWKPAEDHGPALKEIVKAEEAERKRQMKETDTVDPSVKEKKHQMEEELLTKIETFHVDYDKGEVTSESSK